jgi:hypothetical protein
MDKIFENSRLEYLLKKFENNKNKCNYYKLCKYINKKVRKIRKKIKKYNALLTDEAGVLIYNSRRKCENTWENYNSGNIKYNNKHEVNLINKSEKLGSSSIYKLNKCGLQTYYISVKLGSNYLQEFEEYGIPIIVLFFLIGFTYGISRFSRTEIEEFAEEAKNDELIDGNGELILTFDKSNNFIRRSKNTVPITKNFLEEMIRLIEIDPSIFKGIRYENENGNFIKLLDSNNRNKIKIINYFNDSITVNF